MYFLLPSSNPNGHVGHKHYNLLIDLNLFCLKTVLEKDYKTIPAYAHRIIDDRMENSVNGRQIQYNLR